MLTATPILIALASLALYFADFTRAGLARRSPLRLGGLAGIATLAAVVGCSHYDELVTKDQACQQKWADIEAQVQRRYDLVPNLVATVKASAAHEESTLEAVTRARAQASSVTLSDADLEDPAKVAAFQKAQDGLHGAISRLLVTQEAYPDLKANAQFHDLMIQLEGTENRIARAREEYNKAVGDYNGTLGRISGQVVNRVTGRPFKPRVYFSAQPEAQAAPRVSF
jgi:LemA protein